MICSTLCFLFIVVLRLDRRTHSQTCPAFGVQTPSLANMNKNMNRRVVIALKEEDITVFLQNLRHGPAMLLMGV
jgi:hypothetical protein